MTKLMSIIATSALLLSVHTSAAEEHDRTELGLLECTIEGGFGLLLGSSKEATCEFSHKDGTTETYSGKLKKLGLDVGVTGESYLKWVVFTPIGNEIGSYALQGDYAGVSAGAALGIGLGANALVGGSDKKIGLQPLSIEGKTGLNLAVGFSTLELAPVN